ncbi:J domain-containing protein [Sinorhizobium fredii]|uniref:hypothetical protein n=1 Tax=Rhizobium fredii TaxID=380 RepID=UPI000595688F|nr:hypothetical protein [Sinorhizobium fredii]WOS62032.1 hypothetical protein SFGR64A_13905 [Sinorhizobium fredii GR64]
MILALLAGWIVFSYFFAEFAPIILLGICHLIGFLFLCLWEVVKLIARALAWLIARIFRGAATALRKCGHGLRLGLLFLFYLADEWRRGPAEEQDDGASDDEGADDQEERQDRGGLPPRDPYADALTRLGLNPGLTLSDLKRAYKQAIRLAHPDAGGSAAAAQAVNAARDVIARRHGWK